MTDTASRSAISPADVVAQADLSPDAAMQGAVEDAPATAPRSGRSGLSGSVIAGIGLVCLIALWIFSVRVLRVPPYILPAPEAVLNALWSGLAIDPASPKGYYVPLWSTLSNAATGFALGTALGLVLGSLMAESRTVEKLLMPYAFALQSLPKVAIAPLVVIWFGFGDGSKVAIAALLAFFPVLINSFTGLRSTEPEKLDLMRSLSATRFETYRMVKLPNAAPFIFAGLDMAVVYALLGAIVAEFLGAQQGMGVVITQAQSVSDVAGVFAALVILGVLGIVLHSSVRRLEHRVVHWAHRGKH
ncbi:MAG TPA: ABC transporter permease [Casimicrobiaceae bacterium]|nr:ABC transporter permease [Casimicrobiaceae bacterium]